MNTHTNPPAIIASPADMLAMIERAARDPNVDIDKMERLWAMHQTVVAAEKERAFNGALADAEAEMTPIRADANNPQTRSRYASYAALDRECKPIYTKHGLSVSFDTEPAAVADSLFVIGILGHRDGYSRRYRVPMPIDTKGAKGTEYMTRTHATSSAMTYGSRKLLVLMFALAVDLDDDGNAAAGYRPRRAADASARMDEHADAAETIEPVAPFAIEMVQGATWADFLQPLQQHVMRARTEAELAEWQALNGKLLDKLMVAKPALFKLFEKTIETRKQELATQ
jgi:hypothetical protein